VNAAPRFLSTPNVGAAIRPFVSLPRRLKLLLAEDDRIVRITVRDALEEQGYVIAECADGTSALRATAYHRRAASGEPHTSPRLCACSCGSTSRVLPPS
jgi:hypothetical protein